MLRNKATAVAFGGLIAAGLVGCSQLPGSNGQQGAVIGGASGAAVGAAVTKNRALGAVIGGAVGAAGGYVVGANSDKITGKDKAGAEEASRRSQENPATADQVKGASNADLNNDGYVTLDEVVALRSAGLNDDQVVEKLRKTNQVFELTEEQKKYLTDRGVSFYVVNQMSELNKSQKAVITNSSGQEVIGRQPQPR